MGLPVVRAPQPDPYDLAPLAVNPDLVIAWLVQFLRDECIHRRGIGKAVLGLSGGVDSAVVAVLCARAFGPDNTFAFLMPYTISSPESLAHANLVVEALGIHSRVIEISSMVDGYTRGFEPDCSPLRLGNICARARMTILFDQSAKLRALPIGTGNKSERLMGYYTWHGDDAPPINPLGDLFKVQVWDVAQALGVPEVIVNKPATADLVRGQTDELDLGIPYRRADPILAQLVNGFQPHKLVERGFDPREVEVVSSKLESTHWKRSSATVAMLSTSSIGDYYLRPVDY